MPRRTLEKIFPFICGGSHMLIGMTKPEHTEHLGSLTLLIFSPDVAHLRRYMQSESSGDHALHVHFLRDSVEAGFGGIIAKSLVIALHHAILWKRRAALVRDARFY